MKELTFETQIINLSKWSEEKFERFQKRKIESQKQGQCDHRENVVFDGEIDELVCEKCNKKWTSFEYMWYWLENQIKPKLQIYDIENTIHFLEKKKSILEEEIKELKSEKRKLQNEIRKIKSLPTDRIKTEK